MATLPSPLAAGNGPYIQVSVPAAGNSIVVQSDSETSRTQQLTVAQLLVDYGLILPNPANATAQLQEILLKVQTELGGRAAEWADTRAGIKQSTAGNQAQITAAISNLTAAAAQAEPFPTFTAFAPPASRNGKSAWALDAGNVYRSNGITWGAPIGNVRDQTALGYADDELLVPGFNPISLPGPHPSGKDLATHPSILDFEQIKGPGGRWGGHRYWMAYTPYPETKQENPCIAYSDDGVDFFLPAGTPNPLVPAPLPPNDFHNDTELTWVSETDSLRLYYRTFRPASGGGGSEASALGTEEWSWMEAAPSGLGAVWTARVKMLDSAIPGQENGVSMAVVRVSANEWRHYYISVGTLRLRTSPDGVSNFGPEQNLGNPWTTWIPWHIGVVRGPSGRYHLLSAGWPVGKSFGDADLSITYAYGEDGKTSWVAEETPQLEVGGWWAGEYLYRPSFILDNEATLSVRVYYGERNQGDVGQQWHIGRAVGRLRVGNRTQTMATKHGLRSRLLSIREAMLGSLSVGLITARNVITQGLTIRNARPEFTMQDTQSNQLRPGAKMRLRHVAGVTGSIYDLLLLEYFDTTANAWKEQWRWNFNAKTLSNPSANAWNLSGLGTVFLNALVASGAVTATDFSATHDVLAARNVSAPTLTAKGVGAAVVLDDDQAGQVVDGVRVRWRHVAATTGSPYDLMLLERFDPAGAGTWTEYVRWNLTTLEITYASGKFSSNQFKNIRAEIASVDAALRLYGGGSGFSRMQQIEGAFQVSPLQSNNVVALRLEYNSATTPDAWTMDSMGLLSFKPLPASAVAGRTNVMFVDSADSLLKYKDGAGVIKNVTLT